MKDTLKVIGIVLNIVFIFIRRWLTRDLEQRRLLRERLDTLRDLLKKAYSDDSEVINEDDFLSNIDWETRQRYEAYREDILNALLEEKNIHDLKKITKMGLGNRIQMRYIQVGNILDLEESAEIKAHLIAKEISVL